MNINRTGPKPPVPPAGSNGRTFRGARLRGQFLKPNRPSLIKKALIVDDVRSAIRSIRLSLEPLGIEPAAVDPKLPIEAQVLELASDCELVIMDGRMPNTSGEMITQKLRAQGYTGNIMANSDNHPEIQAMLKAGADFANIMGDPLAEKGEHIDHPPKRPDNLKSFFAA